MRSRCAPARRMTLLALVVFGAGAPLLPTPGLKVAATLAAALLLLAAWYARVLAGEALGRTALDAPAVTFLLVASLATLGSGAPAAGVLGSSLRQDALLVYMAYVTMALAAARLGRRDAVALIVSLVAGGSVMGVIAVAQFYGLDLTRWAARMGTLPALPSAGTLGNRIFLGGYLSLLLPVCAGLAADEGQRRWWLYAAAAAVAYAALVASQTRAAWAGSAIAGVLLVRLLRASPAATRRLAALGAAFATVTVVMMLTQPHAALEQRALSTLNPGDPSLQQRVSVWRQTLSLIRRAPVLGWGFSTPLDRLPGASSAAALRAAGGRAVVVDTTHNELLHIAYVSGVAGLAAYLWVWATLVMRLRAALQAPAAGPSLTGAILASLLGYFVWLQTAWTHLGPAHVFWVLAGVAVALARPDEHPGPSRPGTDGRGPAGAASTA
jgi:O-antigen ligase